MKTLALMLILTVTSIYAANAHWSDSYNGDYEEIGPLATIIGFIVMIILCGIFEHIDDNK